MPPISRGPARRALPWLSLLLSPLLAAGRADACADMCGASDSHCLSFADQSFADGCGFEDRGFLDVNNDSRVNLGLLYAAAIGVPYRPRPTEAEATQAHAAAKAAYTAALAQAAPGAKAVEVNSYDGDAQACRSNGYEAATAFLGALGAEPVAQPARGRLAALRNDVLALCAGYEHKPGDVDSVLSGIAAAGPQGGGELGGYLRGAALFYAGRLDEALAALAPLAQAKSPWVRETAQVVAARAYLVRAQTDWNGYYEQVAKVKPDDLHRAAEGFAAYLTAFPAGRYHGSVASLKRRILRLAGDAKGAAALVEAALAEARAATAPLSAVYPLLDEIDRLVPYLTTVHRSDPLLAAAGVMAQLRGGGDAVAARLPALRAAVDAAAPTLDEVRGLRPYLLALLGEAAKDYAEALRQADAAAAAPGAIGFGAALVKGRALEGLTRYDEAAAHWTALLAGRDRSDPARSSLAVALARVYLESGKSAALFSGSSPLAADPRVPAYAAGRLVAEPGLAAAVAAPATAEPLRKAAREALAMRYLLAGNWQAFLTAYDGATLAKGFGAVETAVRSLAHDPADAKALLNVGYFLQTSSERYAALQLCPSQQSLDWQVKETLPTAYLNPGKTYADPLTLYRRALAANPKDADLEAKLLYHMIMCFKPGEASGNCRFNPASNTVDEATRKAWFQTLKQRHGASPWAKKLKYFY